MKPRWLGIIAALVTAGLGYWLITQPHTSRELLLVMVAWLLGFWVASGIRSPAPVVDKEVDDEESDEEGEFDEEDDEDYDEADYEER